VWCVLLHCILSYCTVLYCPVLHFITLPKGVDPFAGNNNNNNNNKLIIKNACRLVPEECRASRIFLFWRWRQYVSIEPRHAALSQPSRPHYKFSPLRKPQISTLIIFMNVPVTGTTGSLHPAGWLSGNLFSFDKWPVNIFFGLPTVVVTCLTPGKWLQGLYL